MMATPLVAREGPAKPKAMREVQAVHMGAPVALLGTMLAAAPVTGAATTAVVEISLVPGTDTG